MIRISQSKFRISQPDALFGSERDNEHTLVEVGGELWLAARKNERTKREISATGPGLIRRLSKRGNPGTQAS
jgi:hypothetical protein